MVNAARDNSLNSIYKNGMDPRRIVHDGPPDLKNMVRDGKCHEVVMWFIHHLSIESQREVAQLVALPFLPRVRHYMGEYKSDAHKAIAESYDDEISCADC